MIGIDLEQFLESQDGALFDVQPDKDKQLVHASGQAHHMTLGVNRHRFRASLHGFSIQPPRKDRLER